MIQRSARRVPVRTPGGRRPVSTMAASAWCRRCSSRELAAVARPPRLAASPTARCCWTRTPAPATMREHGTLPLGDGPYPLLIDEWHLAPQTWNRVQARQRRPAGLGPVHPHRVGQPRRRHHPPFRGRPGGPGEDAAHVTVRVGRSQRRGEPGLPDSTEAPSSAWHDGPAAERRSDAQLRDVIEAMCRGGWPACRAMSVRDAQEFLEIYLEESCRVDVPRANGVKHNPDGVRRALLSLARHTASSPTGATLASDIERGTPESPPRHSPHTSTRWHASSSQRTSHQPGRAHLASRSAPSQGPQAPPHRSGVGNVCALGAMPPAARNADPRDPRPYVRVAGCERPARLRSSLPDASVFHYLDSNHLEADAIIQRRERSVAGSGSEARRGQLRGRRGGVSAQAAPARGHRAYGRALPSF